MSVSIVIVFCKLILRQSFQPVMNVSLLNYYTRSLYVIPSIASGESLPMPPSPPIRSTSIGCSGLFSEGVFNLGLYWDKTEQGFIQDF